MCPEDERDKVYLWALCALDRAALELLPTDASEAIMRADAAYRRGAWHEARDLAAVALLALVGGERCEALSAIESALERRDDAPVERLLVAAYGASRSFGFSAMRLTASLLCRLAEATGGGDGL